MTGNEKWPTIAGHKLASLGTRNSLSTEHCCPSIYPASQEASGTRELHIHKQASLQLAQVCLQPVITAQLTLLNHLEESTQNKVGSSEILRSIP